MLQPTMRGYTGPTPLPPVIPEPPELAGRAIGSARAVAESYGGLPDPAGGQWGVSEATYQLTIDAPEKLTSYPRRTFGEVVREAQRRAIALGGIAHAVLQARDGTWYISPVRFAKPIPKYAGFTLLELQKLKVLDITRAASAASLLAIVGTRSGINFSSQPWPSMVEQISVRRARRRCVRAS